MNTSHGSRLYIVLSNRSVKIADGIRTSAHQRALALFNKLFDWDQ
jgi:hypothetical protein